MVRTTVRGVQSRSARGRTRQRRRHDSGRKAAAPRSFPLQGIRRRAFSSLGGPRRHSRARNSPGHERHDPGPSLAEGHGLADQRPRHPELRPGDGRRPPPPSAPPSAPADTSASATPDGADLQPLPPEDGYGSGGNPGDGSGSGVADRQGGGGCAVASDGGLRSEKMFGDLFALLSALAPAAFGKRRREKASGRSPLFPKQPGDGSAGRSFRLLSRTEAFDIWT